MKNISRISALAAAVLLAACSSPGHDEMTYPLFLDKFCASDRADFDHFGISVDLDGDYAIVGANEDDDKGRDSGSAFVYLRSGSGWTQAAKLTASDGEAEDYFGCSVAISGDCAIVGAYEEDERGTGSGAAYVFQRSGSGWAQVAKLTASDGAAGDRFGCSVALDGEYALVGAYVAAGAWDNSGAAYVFQKPESGWADTSAYAAKLAASDGTASGQFGSSVALDGECALIGAPRIGAYENSAYVFRRSGSVWTQAAKLTAWDGTNEDRMGASVDLSGDYAAVGAWAADGNTGCAYVFRKPDSGWADTDQYAVKLSASDGAEEDYFGRAVAIEGEKLLVGVPYDCDRGTESGSAYFYRLSGSDWPLQAKITAPDGAAQGCFGFSMALDGEYAMIGAFGDSAYAGAVYFWQLY